MLKYTVLSLTYTALLEDIGVGVKAAHQGSASCSLGCIQLYTAPIRCSFALHQCKVSLIFQSLHNFHLRPDQKAIIILMTIMTITMMIIYKLILSDKR